MATRDMTRREFQAAIKRRGWRLNLMWITGTDKLGRTAGIGLIMTQKGGRWELDRRASLAKAISELVSAE